MLNKTLILEGNWTWEEIVDNCETEEDFALVEFANGDIVTLLDNL